MGHVHFRGGKSTVYYIVCGLLLLNEILPQGSQVPDAFNTSSSFNSVSNSPCTLLALHILDVLTSMRWLMDPRDIW
jgi:hypothetical protein